MKRTLAFALVAVLAVIGGFREKMTPEGELISLCLGGGHMARDSFYLRGFFKALALRLQ